MSSINLQFGFNVPRKIIYDAFVDQMYLTNNEGKLCSILVQKQKSRTEKVVISRFLTEGYLVNFWLFVLENI